MTVAWSFRRRLALIAAAAVAVVVVAGSALGYVVVRGTLMDGVDDSLREAAAQIPAVPGPSHVRQTIQLEGPPLEDRALYIELADAAGAVGAPPEGALDLGIDPEEARAVAAGVREPFFRDASVGGGRVRVLVAQAAPGLAVQVARSTEDIDGSLSRLRTGLLVLCFAGIAVAGGLGAVTARAAASPVARMTAVAEHVAATRDLSRRIEAAGDDELARLGRAFNAMLGALDDALRAQRSLVADASHELRTPLTSLRTNVEVLAAADRLSAPDRERLRADVLAQLEELTALVGDLVDLARADEPAAMTREAVRLDELASAAVERARRHSPGIAFELDAAPAVLAGDPARLDRALANLLANAATWSPDGGCVRVRVRDGELVVTDEGPGIPEADRERIFDRFFRSDAARGRPGSGLGLAIVRQVAEAHGATVRAGEAPGGGALLRLSWPS